MINIGISEPLLELSIESILKFITKEQIYRRYLPGNFEFNMLFSSPFRKDKRPSFIIGDHKQSYKWKDFTTGERDDCFSFVSKLHNISFLEGLAFTVKDFSLFNKIKVPYDINVVKQTARYENPRALGDYSEIEREITIKIRDWNQEDIDYWKSMGVSKETATWGYIFPIEYYFINKMPVKCPRLTFAFGEHKDDKWTFKIYQPKNPYKKWTNYNDSSVIELWSKLPEKGNYLIIASSRKDSLCVIENLRIPSIAFQGEAVTPKEKIMLDLKSRFKHIFLFYDNDYSSDSNWGQINARKITDKYDFVKNIFIPTDYLSKDPSDCVDNHNVELFKTISRDLILNALKV